MRPLLLSLFLALPLPLHVHGQGQDDREPAGAGAVIEVLPGDLAYGAEVRVRGAPAYVSLRWRVSPDLPGLYTRVINASRSVVIAGPPGAYTVTAELVSRKVGKLTKPLSEYKEGDDFPVVETVTGYSKVVTLTGGVSPVPPGPGPGPGPGPIPPPIPPPVDPLVASLRAAATTDGWPPAKLAALGSAFRAAADVTVAGRTAAESQQARKRVLAQSLPEGVPANLAAVCSAVQREADAFLPPSDPTHVVTADDAAKVKAIYGRLAAACSEASR
jgi:hypothetical protein